MKNNKKGFTLIELLAVIVILALIMGIAITAMSDVLSKSEANAARRTAASLIDGVRQRLTLAGNIQVGCYSFDNSILEKGGVTSPFGGDWKYETRTVGSEGGPTAIRNVTGVYSITCPSSCTASQNPSYINIDRVSGTGVTDAKFNFSICLTAGSGNAYISGTETDIQKDESSVIKES